MTERILIIGSGGHGQVLADALLQMIDAGAGYQFLGFLDDNPVLHGELFLGLPVLGDRSALSRIPHDAVLLAVGDNIVRRKLYLQLVRVGERFICAVHPHAVIAPGVTIGPNCAVMAGAIINTGTIVASNVILNTGCTVDHHCRIGAHVHLGPGAHLGGDVNMEEGCFVGIGATIMPGRTIHAWATIGAGALAHRDVPAAATIVGVPGRILNRGAS